MAEPTDAGPELDIHSLCFQHLDPHLVAAILLWLVRHVPTKAEEAKKLLLELLEVHPILWCYEKLQGGISEKAKARNEKCTATYLDLEAKVSPLATCLITIKGETTEQGDRHASTDRRSILEWNELWQLRAKAIKNEMRQMLETCSPDKEADIRAKYEADLVAFSPFGPESLNALSKYAQAFYEGGDYLAALYRARFYLDCVCDLVSEAARDEAGREEFLWGSILSSCMLTRPEVASPGFDMGAVPQYILQLSEIFDGRFTTNQRGQASRDEKSAVEHKSLVELTWLLHLSVWVIFRCYLPGVFGMEKKTARLSAWTDHLDWFFSEKCQQCIFSLCPHLLRYYAVLGILNRKREDQLKIITQAVANGVHRYSDPFTRFLTAMFVERNFEMGQVELPKLKESCASDFFLHGLADEVEEQSRLIVFDNYCRIHRSINIKLISDKLHMDAESAEKWIVTLIRDSRLDAKIDSEKNVVEMTIHTPASHSVILERTRNLIYRSQSLFQTLEKAAISTTAAGGPTQIPHMANIRGTAFARS